MPKEIHDKLAKQARKRGLKGDAYKGYVFGTLKRIENKKRGRKKKAVL